MCLHSREAGLRLLGEVALPDGGRHSESVLGAVQAALAQSGVTLAQVNRLITSSGPGSFTGLRVAHASLKAFYAALQIPVEFVDGHEARAWAFAKETGANEFAVTTRLTRDQILASDYRVQNGVPVLEKEEIVAAPPAGTRVDEEFPLLARHLAECLETAQSRQTAATPEAIAAASPRYYGSRFS